MNGLSKPRPGDVDRGDRGGDRGGDAGDDALDFDLLTADLPLEDEDLNAPAPDHAHAASPDAPSPLDAARRRERAGWIAEIAAGGPPREGAMRRLVGAYERRATRWLAYQFRLSWADADDVWQETLINVCRNAGSFQPGWDPWRWIRKIAHNKALDLLKRSSTRHETHTADGSNPAEGQAAANDGPRDFDLGRCVQRGLALFQRAHPGRLEPLLQLELEGCDIPELTAWLGKPSLEATRTHFSALRRQFRPFIEACLELLKP